MNALKGDSEQCWGLFYDASSALAINVICILNRRESDRLHNEMMMMVEKLKEILESNYS